MKLSSLYSNKPTIFEPIRFIDGLNVVMAEIRLPANLEKDTHNLGKSTLGRLLDFALLAGRDPKAFLFKNFEVFKGFVFFIELQLADSSFLTVRRSVEEASKVSFKKHAVGHQDFSTIGMGSWDHEDVAFERAQELLDSLLDWRTLRPWTFRNGVGYLLRSQHDYRDVFHLNKFKSGHGSWKPFLAHVLGFDGRRITDHYEKEEALADSKATEQTLNAELGGSVQDVSKIEGILLLKQKDVEKKQRLLDAFDFRAQDKQKTKSLVDDIDDRVSALNEQRYSLNQNRKKVVASLEDDQILFDPVEAHRLFEEVNVQFEGQIKRDFEQLIAFNRAITDERRGYLQEEREEIEAELKAVNAELNTLGKRRSDMLKFLSGTDAFGKYRQMTDEVVVVKADIIALERQRSLLHRLQELRGAIRVLAEELGRVQSEIELDVEQQNADQHSRFSAIRVFFSEIVEEVIDRKALLSVSPNQLGHLEFSAEILDEGDKTTSADDGHTYRKLLCIAFDLAVLRAHLSDPFPRFVYHDGVFESLDDRKKRNLLAVVRRYADMGLQPIITLIDSDLPVQAAKDSPVFSSDEIILRLHDEGEQGRIFKMKSW